MTESASLSAREAAANPGAVVGLTPKQTAFVREYLVDLNATQAAIRAGYSPKTAKVQGSRLLTYADIAAAVDAGNAKRAAKLELSAEKVLSDIERLSRLAESMGELGVAMKGQELLGKHLELFTEKHKHTHRFADLTDEQLEAKYREAREAMAAEGAVH